MSNVKIPESWATAMMGEIFTIVGGGTPASSNKAFYTDSGKGIAWITPADLGKYKQKLIFHGSRDITQAGLNSCSARLLPPGSVLFSSRAPIGHLAIAGKPVCTNQGFKSIAKSDYIDSDFIYYQLRYLKDHVASLGSGTTFKEVSGTVMKTVKFNLPPMGEQKRIVAKIESTHEKIKVIEDSVTKAEELIEKYREALLQKAFRGELVKQDPNDEPASKLLERIRAERAQASDSKKKKKDDLPPIKPEEIPFEIPKSWEWVRLAELSSTITDGDHQTPKRTSSGEMMLSAKNIRDGYLSFEDVDFISQADFQKSRERCCPIPGDLLMVSVGATIGRCAIVGDKNKFSLVRSVALIRSVYFKPELLYWLMQTDALKKQIKESQKSDLVPDAVRV